MQSLPTPKLKIKALLELKNKLNLEGKILLIEGNARRLTKHPRYNFYLSYNQWKKVFIEPEKISGLSMMSFHVSRTWNPKASGYSEDERDLGTAIAIPNYDSIVSSNVRASRHSNAGVLVLKNI